MDYREKLSTTWEFPKIRATFLGVPIVRIILFWGLHWGPSFLGNYHMSCALQVTSQATMPLQEFVAQWPPQSTTGKSANLRLECFAWHSQKFRVSKSQWHSFSFLGR